MSDVKIKNIASFPLEFYIKGKNKRDILIKIKPSEYLYSDSNETTRALIIYERKKIINITQEEKPGDLDYFKAYHEEELPVNPSIEPDQIEIEIQKLDSLKAKLEVFEEMTIPSTENEEAVQYDWAMKNILGFSEEEISEFNDKKQTKEEIFSKLSEAELQVEGYVAESSPEEDFKPNSLLINNLNELINEDPDEECDHCICNEDEECFFCAESDDETESEDEESQVENTSESTVDGTEAPKRKSKKGPGRPKKRGRKKKKNPRGRPKK